MLRREREERERLARELESQTLSGFARWVFVLFCSRLATRMSNCTNPRCLPDDAFKGQLQVRPDHEVPKISKTTENASP